MSIKTADQLEAYFKKLQIEQKGHLGDIKLTIEQQDEIVEAFRDVLQGESILSKLESIKDKLDDIINEVES
jgi:hypothetical protein